MKTAYKYIRRTLPFVLAGLCLVSCNDFLTEDPKGQLTSENFFSNKEDLDASLTALYSVIASSQASNNLCGTNFLVGDDISTHPSSNKQPLREHDQFDVKDNNSWLSSMWEQRFKVIKAANFIINNAGRTPDVSEDEIKAATDRHITESLFLFLFGDNLGKGTCHVRGRNQLQRPIENRKKRYMN